MSWATSLLKSLLCLDGLVLKVSICMSWYAQTPPAHSPISFVPLIFIYFLKTPIYQPHHPVLHALGPHRQLGGDPGQSPLFLPIAEIVSCIIYCRICKVTKSKFLVKYSRGEREGGELLLRNSIARATCMSRSSLFLSSHVYVLLLSPTAPRQL